MKIVWLHGYPNSLLQNLSIFFVKLFSIVLACLGPCLTYSAICYPNILFFQHSHKKAEHLGIGSGNYSVSPTFQHQVVRGVGSSCFTDSWGANELSLQHPLWKWNIYYREKIGPFSHFFPHLPYLMYKIHSNPMPHTPPQKRSKNKVPLKHLGHNRKKTEIIIIKSWPKTNQIHVKNFKTIINTT